MEKIMIIGNLGMDAVIHENNGKPFVSFRVGVSDKVKQNGEEVSRTTWYNCNVGNPNAGFVPYLKKGKKVFVMGRPRYSIYDSQAYRCKMIDITVFVDSLELLSPKEEQVGQEPPLNKAENTEDLAF